MGRLCSKQRTLYCLHGRVAALLGALAYGGGRDCPRSIAAISAAGTKYYQRRGPSLLCRRRAAAS